MVAHDITLLLSATALSMCLKALVQLPAQMLDRVVLLGSMLAIAARTTITSPTIH